MPTYAQDSHGRYELRIEGGSLGQVLKDVHQQSGFEFVYSFELADTDGIKPISGQYTLQEALDIMFEGTGLSGGLTESGVIVITRDKRAKAPIREETGMNKRAKRSLLAGVSALMFGTGTQGVALAQDVPEEDEVRREDPIIVTSTKRPERLQDVPASITAIDATALQRRSISEMGDYLNSVPGVTHQDFGVGTNQTIIRGIGASASELATVSMYLGEMPLNSAGATASTDIILTDIERVEVLRGPQGTLFGSGSMGGTVRNVPNAPNLSEFGGELDLEYSNTADTGGDNYKVSGVLNIPIVEDKLAARIAAFHHNDSGYIDKVSASDPAKSAFAAGFGAAVEDEGDIGSSEYSGIRTTLLFTPTDKLSISFMHLHQDLEQNGFKEVNLGVGEYQQVPLQIGDVNGGDEFRSDQIDFFNLVAEYDLGWASILSTSSWLDGESGLGLDVSRNFPLPLAQITDGERDGFVQEVRLTSQLEGPLGFVAGVYYEDLNSTSVADINWTGSPLLLPLVLGATDPIALATSLSDLSVEQTAVFGEVSYEVAENLTATVGARWFDYDRNDITSLMGNPALAGPGFLDNLSTSESDTVFKANLSYQPNDDVLLYAQWAEGFRLGRPFPPAPAGLCDLDSDGFLDGTNAPIASDAVESDTLDSYELGGKLTLLDGRATVNAAVFNVEWEGIPVTVNAIPNCGFSVIQNAGKARSQGVEAETAFYATDDLLLSLGFSFVNSELSEDDPVLGPKGTRLPGSAEFNFNAGAQYEFDLRGYDSYARADYAYIGSFQNDIAALLPEAGDYHSLNMRAGVDLDQVELSIFATNLTNADDIVSVSGVIGASVNAFQPRPRTVGLSAKLRF